MSQWGGAAVRVESGCGFNPILAHQLKPRSPDGDPDHEWGHSRAQLAQPQSSQNQHPQESHRKHFTAESGAAVGTPRPRGTVNYEPSRQKRAGGKKEKQKI